ncbi:MAG: alkaline phosphatase family protein [Propionivibrio sp.]
MNQHENADYAGGGVFNLMQSVLRACGAPASGLAPCAALPPERPAEKRHLLLFVIDGLGLQALAALPVSSPLRRHLIGSLSSVFPSTTASAITTFMTGLAPAQHGLTGWHVQFDEIGAMLAVLPMTVRGAARSTNEPVAGLPPRLFPYRTVFQQIERDSFVVAPQHIAGTPFNAWHARGATTCAYATLPELFAHLASLLKDASTARYIYAYYPELDAAAHRFGCKSEQAQGVLLALDKAFARFLAEVADSDASVIVTADHGFIDAPLERVICLDDHRPLAGWLAHPLSGERRAAYCHVEPAYRPDFVAYVRQHLAHAVELHASADLIEAGWFGPPPYSPRLAGRVGDYTLVMKDDWTIADWLPGEKRYSLIGVHGGVSVEEMRVPLIEIRV